MYDLGEKMTTKHVTYSTPIKLDALGDALKRQENSLLREFQEADKDLGNREVKEDFAGIEGEGFFEG